MSEPELIHDGVDFCIYHQPVSEFGVPVAVKRLKKKVSTPALMFQLKNEWEQTNDLSLYGLRKAYKLDIANGNNALYLQYVQGISLRQFFTDHPWDLKEIIHVGVQIAKILSGVHAAGVIHKDINPRNILVSDPLREITLIDFGIATKLSLKSDYSIAPEKLEGSLAYISPEQTGRMNRTVDVRSDLYSLGVTLYELLAQRLPFNASNAIEFIYCHIAEKAVAPHVVNGRVPMVVSDIVMKLMEKNAEDRYQSAMGLKHDLETVLRALDKNEPVLSFDLGARDFSNRFQIPQKLYGREREVDQLLHLFDSAADGGSETCCVTGFSGVGKSTLIHEIYRPVTERRGIFIEGKFDQYQRNIPYQAFSVAFRSFVQQLLGDTEKGLNDWRHFIQDALGDNAGVITALIPEFEMIIGKQESPPSVGPVESQNRFNFTFIQFLRELASADHPLVLFLDDLQSADLASLSLLKALISASLSHFYFIGAYRDNEVSSEHPMQVTLNELTKEKIRLHNIQLIGLNEKSVNELVSDTLGRKHSETTSLSAIVDKKTDGNPYFINEFLKSLYEEELIRWDAEDLKWQWDETDIAQKSATENVVQFLTRRITAYPTETLELMMCASCIGNSFSASVLKGVMGKPLASISQQLDMMVSQGYLSPAGTREIKTEEQQTFSVFPEYRFVHDRFQQTVYSLIGEERRVHIHYRIGNYFLELREAGMVDAFDVVNHLNQSEKLVIGIEEKWQLCQLNYEAGLKAKNASAWNAANQYFNLAMSLMPLDAWDKHYDFTFNVVLERAQAEFLNHKVMEAEQLMDALLSKAHSNFDKAKVLSQKTVLYTVIGKNKEAVDVSKQCLGLLKIRVPRSPMGLKLGILTGLLKARWKLRGKHPSWLLSLPSLKSEHGKLIFRTISNSTNPAYFHDREYWAFLQLTGTNYSIKNGNCEYSAFCYACYAILANALFRKYRYAYEFCDVLLKMNDQYFSSSERSRLLSPVSSGISHWILPLPATLKYFHEGYTNAMESGDLWYAGNIMVNRFVTQLKMGNNLQGVFDEFIGFKGFVEKQNNAFLSSEYTLYMLWIKMMATGVEESEIDEFEQDYVRNNKTNEFLIGYLYTFYTRYYLLMGEYSKALIYAEKVIKLANFFLVSPLEADAHFYCTLAICGNASDNNESQVLKIRKRLKLLEKWEENCPENFSAYASIIRGELKRIANNLPEALKFFREAAHTAQQNHLLHLEGLAYEMSGVLCMNNNLRVEGLQHLQDAISIYAQWGGLAKVQKMKGDFPGLETIDKREKTGATFTKYNTLTDSVSLLNENLDLTTIMKASSAISGKVRFDELLNTMMKITMENAGAQSGILFLERKELLPKISINPTTQVKLIVGLPHEEDEELPVSLVQYVYRTNEEVVIDNAASDLRFLKDGFFKKYKPKSVLCVPILQHGEFIGALYMENRLAAGVFTQERLQLIRLLSGQIAVSIENSLAFETLEQKVGQRTEEISRQKDVMEQEKYKSDALLLNILPQEVTTDLKQTGKTKAQLYNDVTVMFADFVSFTKVAETLDPEELLQLIGKYFEVFDDVVEKHQAEKIKTVGDAYICVAGLPKEREDHAALMVTIAFDFLSAVERLNEQQVKEGQPAFAIRIGLSSGPVVAGVVGMKKYAYDIWGDTVNTAARMQENGEANRVNISGTTYEKVKDQYQCYYRGMVEAKNKGPIDMYFVEGRR